MSSRQELIQALRGLEVQPRSANAWGPHGTLAVQGLNVGPEACVFDLLVLTEPADIWDYIWRSEFEAGTTEKVQLHQSGNRIAGSRVIAVAREGDDERFHGNGPDKYRLTFSLPCNALSLDTGIEVQFLWSDEVMSTAGPRAQPRRDTCLLAYRELMEAHQEAYELILAAWKLHATGEWQHHEKNQARILGAYSDQEWKRRVALDTLDHSPGCENWPDRFPGDAQQFPQREKFPATG